MCITMITGISNFLINRQSEQNTEYQNNFKTFSEFSFYFHSKFKIIFLNSDYIFLNEVMT